MKKLKRIFAGALAVAMLLVSMLPATSVKAEGAGKTYTVTFRAGNVGRFNLNAANTTGDGIEATENYIKFTVNKGASLASTYDFIIDDASLDAYFLNITSEGIDTGYRLKGASDWCVGAASTSVNRNTEYVLDYAKLVNAVKYTIYFVDAASGEQIAPPTMAYGNAGEEIACNPLTIADYRTEDAAVSLTLDAENEDANTVTFKYTYTGEDSSTTETITEYEEGDTIVQNEVNEITQETPVGQVTVLDDAENAAGNADAEANGEEQLITIEDEEVPLANEEGQYTTIEDEEVPLGVLDGEFENHWIPVIGWVATAGLALVLIEVNYLKKKRSAVRIKENIVEKKEEK